MPSDFKVLKKNFNKISLDITKKIFSYLNEFEIVTFIERSEDNKIFKSLVIKFISDLEDIHIDYKKITKSKLKVARDLLKETQLHDVLVNNFISKNLEINDIRYKIIWAVSDEFFSKSYNYECFMSSKITASENLIGLLSRLSLITFSVGLSMQLTCAYALKISSEQINASKVTAILISGGIFEFLTIIKILICYLERKKINKLRNTKIEIIKKYSEKAEMLRNIINKISETYINKLNQFRIQDNTTNRHNNYVAINVDARTPLLFNYNSMHEDHRLQEEKEEKVSFRM